MSQGKPSTAKPQPANRASVPLSEEPIQPGGVSVPSMAAVTLYRSDYAVKPVLPADLLREPASLAEFLRSRSGRLAALSTALALFAGTLLGVFAVAPRVKTHAGVHSDLMVRAAAAAVLPPSCLRDSSQTITSDARDALLLDAAKAYDEGRPEQALELLRTYTAEACDRATLEAVEHLSHQLKRSGKEP